MFEFNIFLALLAVVASTIIIRRIKKRDLNRAVMLKAASEKINFTFSPDSDETIISSLSNFFIFKQGFSRNAYNVMKGYVNGFYCVLFDYHFGAVISGHSSGYCQLVAYIQLNNVSLPKFYMGPTFSFKKLADVITGDSDSKNICFDNAPLFSKKYFLKGFDVEAVKNIFTSRVLTFFENNKQSVYIEADGNKLIVYNGEKHVDPLMLSDFVNEVSKIVSLFAKKDDNLQVQTY